MATELLAFLSDALLALEALEHSCNKAPYFVAFLVYHMLDCLVRPS
jgi:hypothetical protein